MFVEATIRDDLRVTVRGVLRRSSPSLGAYSHDAEIYEVGVFRNGKLEPVEDLTDEDFDACRKALMEG